MTKPYCTQKYGFIFSPMEEDYPDFPDQKMKYIGIEYAGGLRGQMFKQLDLLRDSVRYTTFFFRPGVGNQKIGKVRIDIDLSKEEIEKITVAPEGSNNIVEMYIAHTAMCDARAVDVSFDVYTEYMTDIYHELLKTNSVPAVPNESNTNF